MIRVAPFREHFSCPIPVKGGVNFFPAESFAKKKTEQDPVMMMKFSTPSVFSNVLITQYWNVNPAPEKVEPVTERV